MATHEEALATLKAAVSVALEEVAAGQCDDLDLVDLDAYVAALRPCADQSASA